jgi:hypothetical protein
MDAAKGDAVVVMDADLQDRPEVVLEMVAEVKGRPLCVVGRRVGFDRERAAADTPSEPSAALARLR